MAVKSKYELAVAAFVAAKARLYKPGTSWGEYAARITDADAAWKKMMAASLETQEVAEA